MCKGYVHKHTHAHKYIYVKRVRHAHHVNLWDRLPEGRNFPHISLHFKMTATLPPLFLTANTPLFLLVFLRHAKQSVNCLSAQRLLTTSSWQLAAFVHSFMRSIPLSALLYSLSTPSLWANCRDSSKLFLWHTITNKSNDVWLFTAAFCDAY